jgi:large subunit ribosomal protein L10
MERSEKEQEVQFLTDCLTKSQVSVLADFRGMTVADVTTLRKDLMKAGARTRVVKNNLAVLAAERVYKDAPADDLKKLLGLFKGPNVMIFSENEIVEPVKTLVKFAKDRETFKLKGAWFEGRFLTTDGVDQLSKMPSKEEILAKLLALIQAPATQLLRLISAPGTQLVRVLEARRAQLEKAA